MIAPLTSPPQRAYLFGQAPGPVEGVERLPWRGRAGKTLRRWLELDEETFYATFYCASVTRCDPGRASTGRGDRTPSRQEQELCDFWREWELALLRPRLVVTVGGLAARRLLGLRSVTEFVGTRHVLDGGVVAIPLPHPSGASSWLNVPKNRTKVEAAAVLVRAELAALARHSRSTTSNVDRLFAPIHVAHSLHPKPPPTQRG